MTPLSRNGAREDVSRARSKSCSAVDSTGAWDRYASRPPQVEGLPQRQRQSESDWHSIAFVQEHGETVTSRAPGQGRNTVRRSLAVKAGRSNGCRLPFCRWPNRQRARSRTTMTHLCRHWTHGTHRNIYVLQLSLFELESPYHPVARWTRARPRLACAPRIDMLKDIMNNKLFKTPAPFCLNVDDADDDVSIYSTSELSVGFQSSRH